MEVHKTCDEQYFNFRFRYDLTQTYPHLAYNETAIATPRTSTQEAHTFLWVTKATKLLNHNDNIEMYGVMKERTQNWQSNEEKNNCLTDEVPKEGVLKFTISKGIFSYDYLITLIAGVN